MTIPADLAAHLTQTCTTLCHCWRVERRDGAVFGFTDHDRPLTVDGMTYEPGTGLAQSEARTALGMAVDSIDVEGALSSSAIAEADIADGLFDGAGVTTLLVNWREPTQFMVLRRASIGTVKRLDGRFVAELEGLAAALDRPNGRTLRRGCDAELGDGRCGVVLEGETLTAEGAVIMRLAPGQISVGGLEGFEPGWFSHGRVTWTSGDLAGRVLVVLDHRLTADGTVLAVPPGAATPATATTFTIVAGCDKRFSTCRTKFGNAVNFRGFPHLPGNDAAYAYVAEGTEFDGKALVA